MTDHDRRTFLRLVGASGVGIAATGPGSAAASSDGSVTAGGADIWNRTDEFHYLFTDVSGDFDVTVRVDSLEETDPYAKAGLMLRESLAADAANVMVRRAPDHTTVQWRPETGSEAGSLTSDLGEDLSEVSGGTMEGRYQRLVRRGDTVTAYGSSDGTDWTRMVQLSEADHDLPETGYIGLAVTSHSTGTPCTAAFSELSGTTPTHSRDVGDVDVDGSASWNGASINDGPLAATGPASALTESSMTLSGSLDHLGTDASIQVAFEYRERGASSWSRTDAETISSRGEFSRDVSDLSTNTEYEYRAVAVDGDGDRVVGSTATVTTLRRDTDPSISTGPATEQSASTATLSGTLESIGGQASSALVSFEYREVDGDEWQSSGSLTRSEPGEFEQTVYGLSPATDYEFRATVEADDGDTDIGSTVTVRTDSGVDTDAGSYFDPEDGFADVDWFDDEVQVIRIQELDLDVIQEAFQTEGPRLIVFEASGVLDMDSAQLEITEPNCWVAGQTAPSPGVTFIDGFVQVDADDVVVEHIRVLRGDQSGGEGTDPMNSADGTANVIFSHCTSFWGRDENLSVGYDSDRTTFANCLIAEGLEDPEENSNGTLVGNGAKNVAIMGTVYAKNNDRNPRLKADTETVVVNGLNFYHDKAIWIDGGAEAAVVGNAYIHRFSFRDPLVFGDGSVYFEDNYVADPPLNGRPFQNVGTELESPPLWPDGLEAMPAGDVESHNLTFAGARPADRIGQEEKVVRQIRDRWGDLDVDPNRDNAGFSDIPDSAAEAGGYPDHGGTTHTLEVPESGLREWLRRKAVEVEVGDENDGDAGPDTIFVGDYEARDPDDDGRYEDVNGDETTTHGDVNALFENRDADGVQNNPDPFDFDENGRFGFSDIPELLREI
ncbi:hypothetical protein [Natrinema salinisoli]|uniref:hypothetical protein n=1 Tax=Natrinema salinisoli TaxID=2878535 RepID=UPI001CF08F11|nr:hypothetical protein [Natrinema salinisoli]